MAQMLEESQLLGVEVVVVVPVLEVLHGKVAVAVAVAVVLLGGPQLLVVLAVRAEVVALVLLVLRLEVGAVDLKLPVRAELVVLGK